MMKTSKRKKSWSRFSNLDKLGDYQAKMVFFAGDDCNLSEIKKTNTKPIKI